MIVKIVAYGFILDKGSYLRVSWNVLDFTIVTIGLISTLASAVGGGDGADIKALR